MLQQFLNTQKILVELKMLFFNKLAANFLQRVFEHISRLSWSTRVQDKRRVQSPRLFPNQVVFVPQPNQTLTTACQKTLLCVLTEGHGQTTYFLAKP